jgi:hypothetical protein
MTTFVPAGVELSNGPLYIEVEPTARLPEEEAPQDVAPAELLSKLDAVGEAAGEACLALYDKMHDRLSESAALSEVSVEFGITLGGEAGIPFVAKGTAEATFQVTATWNFSASSTSSPHGGGR